MTSAAGSATRRGDGREAPWTPRPRRFTTDEYYRMAEAGILGPDERLELIEGVIYQMSPIGSRHAHRVSELDEWFVRHVPSDAAVRCQNPVHLSEWGEPEPDIAIVRRRPEGYSDHHPGPADILLIIEVADTSLAHDRDRKVPMYAVAGIVDYWIAHLTDDVVLIFREPKDGQYTSRTVARRGEQITPLSFPDLDISVDDILG